MALQVEVETSGKHFTCILEIPITQMDAQQLNYGLAQCAFLMNECPSGLVSAAVRSLTQDISEALMVEQSRRSANG